MFTKELPETSFDKIKFDGLNDGSQDVVLDWEGKLLDYKLKQSLQLHWVKSGASIFM